MKIKKYLEQYGYPAVMGICLVCSAALLISVTTDRPLVAIAQPHMPVLRSEQSLADGEHLSEPAAEPMEEGTAEETAKSAPEAAETDAVKEDDLQETLSGTGSGYLLTEDFLEEQLTGFLPESFPAEDVDVSFDGGMLTLSFDMSRAKLKEYLKAQGAELGMKRNLLLQMLPRQVELEAVFALTADESGLHLSPVHLAAGDKSISLSGLPQDTFSAVDEGINALLSGAGVAFSSAEFTKDGLLLK